MANSQQGERKAGPRVLISGASVAGPTVAYWLLRTNATIVLLERSPSLRIAGQGIDVRDSARTVIRRMGIFSLLRSKSSNEAGVSIVNSSNKILAKFEADFESGKGDSAACDIEILRGELARILVDKCKEGEGRVEFVFGEYVSSMRDVEGEDGVWVEYVNGRPKEKFDLVVAADGLGSKIRDMTFPGEEKEIRSLNSYCAYFSIDIGPTDSSWSRAYWLSNGGGRSIFLRPDNVGRTRTFLTLVAYSPNDPRLALLAKAAKEGIPAQKTLFASLFSDAGFEIERVLKGMEKADDFYMQHVAQVRLKRWSKGRVVMVGDSGYAPSPFTGMGTSLAFIGAYVLAGEVSAHPGDIPAALAAYEKNYRPYVDAIQSLPPGVPWLVNPQSKIGVKILENAVWAIGILQHTFVPKAFSLLAKLTPFKEPSFELPYYEAFREQVETME